MYYLLLFLLLLALFSTIFFHYKKKKIIAKLKCMKKAEKCSLLDDLTDSFGYRYHCKCGAFSSTLNAWQKQAGYTYLYDHAAPHFQMVFDFLPVYFDYAGKTWLIEFWKGQYGINTGAEIGIYYADSVISPKQYRTAFFHGVSENDMLLSSFTLVLENGCYVEVTQQHWWLTAFLPGIFSKPADLTTKNTLTFPNREMLTAFKEGLQRSGYGSKEYEISGLTLSFCFQRPKKKEYCFLSRLLCHFSQWKNKMFCKLYREITKPFSTTEDRILFLYFFLPVCFRKVLRMHRFDRRCHRKKRCMKRRDSKYVSCKTHFEQKKKRGKRK